MKKILHFLLLLLLACSSDSLLIAQVKIGALPGTPHPAALLELESNNRGLLLPRLTTAEMSNVSADAQAKGLLIYNTDSNRLYVFNGIHWRPVMYSTPIESWQLTGNSGTTPATQFVGTLDSAALNIRTFNRPHVTFTPNRLTGIYTTNPSGLLTIESLNRPGSEDDVLIDNYISGPASGSNPSFIISTRQGTPAAPQDISGTNTYLGGFYQAGRVGSIDLVLSGMDAYYRSTANNLLASDLRFYTSGVDRMYISPDGLVGIGTMRPAGGLDVTSYVDHPTGDDITSITYSTTNEPSFIAYRNRGNGINPQPVVAGDRLGEFRFDGNLSGNKTSMAKITGQYLGGTGASLRSRLTFSVNGQTDTQLVLDSTGFAGLGTNSPISALDIMAFNKSDASDDINIRTFNNNAGPALLLYRARTNGQVPANLQNNDFLGILNFSGEVNGNNVGLSSIVANYTGNGTTTLSSLSFRTSGNQGMLLNDKGWLTIGNSSQPAGATADIQGSLRYKFSVPTGNAVYTLTNTDLMVLVTEGVGPSTIALPASGEFDGHFIIIKNNKLTPISISAGTSVLTCNGGGTGCSSLGAQRVIGLAGQFNGSTMNWIQVF